MQKHRVLIVEDEQDIAGLIKHTLERSAGAEAEVVYERYCPVTFNHADETDHAIHVARDVAGENNVDPDVDPSMAGEDFSFMLKERPGAFIFIGNGDSAGLHNPGYDFNDDAIAYGISYWVKLAEQRLTN